MGYDAHEYIDEFPSDAIAEIHLGGFTPEEDPAAPGAELWIDTHAAAIAADHGISILRDSPLRAEADTDRMG